VKSRLLGSQGHPAWGGEIDEAESVARGDRAWVRWGRREVKSMKQGQRDEAMERVWRGEESAAAGARESCAAMNGNSDRACSVSE
jgi:hypothetical protein